MVLALVGVGLAAIPWLLTEDLEPLPARVAPGDALVRQALAVAASVDKASVQGRADDVRRRVTARCWQQLGETLAQVGRPLDGRTLREQGAWIGTLERLELLAGGGAGERLLLVFDGAPDGLVTARWVRRGDQLLFDERLGVPVPPGANARLLAEDIVRGFVDAR